MTGTIPENKIALSGALQALVSEFKQNGGIVRQD
jgi:hypothetical protein